MMILNIAALFPLQSEISNFWRQKSSSSNTTLLLGVLFGIIAFVFIIAALSRKKTTSKPSSGPKLFSGFSLRNFVRNIGLSYDQEKMLNFVFKTDDVLDPEKSLNTPSLLDRHFERAYHEIEHSQDDPEKIQRRLGILFSTRNTLENSMTKTISSTHQLHEDIVFIVSYGKDKLNLSLLNAETEHLIVEAPKNVLGTQIKIPQGTKLNVLFFTQSNKGFVFESRVIGYANFAGKPILEIAHSNQVRLLAQRRFRRRRAVIACFLSLVYVEGSGKKQRMVVDKRRLVGNIDDISVGGCSVKISAPVQVGARFKIEFTRGKDKVAALGQVLRTNRAGVNMVIHVKFLRVSQKSMNIINAFVYEYANE